MKTSLRFDGRTDRLYTEPDDFNLIHDDGWDRTIEVHHYHHSDVVLNPGRACKLNERYECRWLS